MFYRTIKIDLDSFDVNWQNSFLIFKTFAVKEFPELQKKLSKAKDDSSETLAVVLEVLKEKFVDGEIGGQKISADDLENFDLEIFTEILNRLTGEKK